MKNMMQKMKQSGRDDIKRCPLSGAAKAISMIDDAAMLVIGTEECTYYTKSTLDMRGMGENCFSVVLDKNDVTFGSLQKVTEAVHELLSEYQPKELFLVTTCVVEVIGDDFNALAEDATEQYHIPVHVIQTNHFKGKDDEYGFELVENASESMGNAMSFWGKIGGKIGNKMGGKHGRGKDRMGGQSMRDAGMTEEQMMERMRMKMGSRMTEDEMREKIKMKMGGRV